ncbi:MAG: archaetidylserine synthase [Methanobacterium sp.]|nr:archaetidylserine synthase [Methanobacterium sp.]
MNIKHHMSYADIVSIGNASSGFLSIIMVLNGYMVLAAQFILIAVIFDALDGWVARKTKRVDELGFGENIDSLSDVVSFGVAPGIFLYSACASFNIPYINIIIALLILICGLLRLTRFNVILDSNKELVGKFVGLPIPSTALVLGSFYLSGIFRADIALIIMTIVSVLMISTIIYPKFKGMKIILTGSTLIFLTLLSQNISIITTIPAKLLFIGSLTYVIIIPIMDLYAKLRRSDPNVR